MAAIPKRQGAAEEASDIVAALVPGRVLGIDPGLGVTGYAVIESRGATVRVHEAGVIRPRGGSAAGLPARLRALHDGVVEVIEAFGPSCLAIEQVHSHHKHPRTSILMAHARGVIVLAAEMQGLTIHDYAATRIKKTITGNGRAPKEQMQHAIQVELRLAKLPEPHDVADACAVALCHLSIARNAAGLKAG